MSEIWDTFLEVYWRNFIVQELSCACLFYYYRAQHTQVVLASIGKHPWKHKGALAIKQIYCFLSKQKPHHMWPQIHNFVGINTQGELPKYYGQDNKTQLEIGISRVIKVNDGFFFKVPRWHQTSVSSMLQDSSQCELWFLNLSRESWAQATEPMCIHGSVSVKLLRVAQPRKGDGNHCSWI